MSLDFADDKQLAVSRVEDAGAGLSNNARILSIVDSAQESNDEGVIADSQGCARSALGWDLAWNDRILNCDSSVRKMCSTDAEWINERIKPHIAVCASAESIYELYRGRLCEPPCDWSYAEMFRGFSRRTHD